MKILQIRDDKKKTKKNWEVYSILRILLEMVIFSDVTIFSAPEAKTMSRGGPSPMQFRCPRSDFTLPEVLP